MRPEDKEVLKELLFAYPPETFIKGLMDATSDAADEASDMGYQKRAKKLSLLAQTLEDITSGRPFLV